MILSKNDQKHEEFSKIENLRLESLTSWSKVPPLLEIIIQIKIFERKIFKNFSIFFWWKGIINYKDNIISYKLYYIIK